MEARRYRIPAGVVPIAAWLDLVALSAAGRRPLRRGSPKFPIDIGSNPAIVS
jgi:hypothetical protein